MNIAKPPHTKANSAKSSTRTNTTPKALFFVFSVLLLFHHHHNRKITSARDTLSPSIVHPAQKRASITSFTIPQTRLWHFQGSSARLNTEEAEA
jgi:hypothetical protein